MLILNKGEKLIKHFGRPKLDSKGSALIQALVLVSMVGLVSVGLTQYSRITNSAMQFDRNDNSVIGVGQLISGTFKSDQLCSQANIDFNINGGAFNNNLGTPAQRLTDINNNTATYPMRVFLPHYDAAAAYRPFANPLTDPMLSDFGVAVSTINIRLRREINPGNNYEAEVIAGFVRRERLGSNTLVPAGSKRIATIMVIRGPGNQFQNCVTVGTAADFCTDMGCTPATSVVTGQLSCVCGAPSITCPAGQVLDQVTSGGAGVCVGYTPTLCPSGQYLVRVNANGTPDCENWPFTNCVVPVGGATWTNAGSGSPPNCSNDTQVVIPAGESRPVGDLGTAADTTAGTVGRAYFYCPYASSLNPTPAAVPSAHSAATPQECTLY